MGNKGRLLCWSDSPTCFTGYATVSRHVLMALHRAGYTIEQLAINYHANFVDKAQVPWQMVPARYADPNDPYGCKMFLDLLRERDYDYVWIMNDYFVVNDVARKINEVKSFRLANNKKVPKIVYYYPVDYKVLPEFGGMIELCDVPVAYADFGVSETLKVFPNIKDRLKQIPHGCDTETFRPLGPQAQENIKMGSFNLAPDTFFVIAVNRNTVRKQLPYSLLAFQEFKKRVPNSVMYIHAMPKDQGGDLTIAIRDTDLDPQKDIILPYGYTPQSGVPDEVMNQIYNAADLSLTTALGEGWGLCLHPLTIVDTLEGSIPVKDIMVGDKVVGQDGLYHNVLDTTHRYTDELYKVNSVYTEDTLVTKEHPFFALLQGTNTPEWYNVQQLRPNDYIALVKPNGNKPLPKSIDLLEYIDKSSVEFDDTYIWYKMGYSPNKNGMSISDIQKHFNVSKRVAEDARRCLLGSSLPSRGLPGSFADSIAKAISNAGLEPNTQQAKIRRYIPVNDEFLYFIGWYLAEGSNGNKKRVELDLHIDEKSLANRLATFAEEYFGLSPVVEQNGQHKCRLRLSSGVLANVLGEICGVHSINKRVPDFLMESGKYLGQLIRGLFEGDGHLNESKNHISLATTSTSLAYQARHICAANNILLSVKKYNRNDSENLPIYTCRVAVDFLDKWINLTKVPVAFQARKIEYNNYIETDEYFFIKIKGVCVEEYNGEVYDLCVEDTHSFVANGVLVHNTTTEVMAAGTPVVAPYNSVNPQIFGKNSERGYLYKCRDRIWVDNQGMRPKGYLEDVVGQMVRCYKAGSKWKNNKCHLARQWVENHTWDKVTQMWLDLFNDLGKTESAEKIKIVLEDI